MKYIFLILLSVSALADTSREVFIKGKIGNDFNEKSVKVIDSFGQSYYLSRHLFPKGFKFKQGEPFALEVHEKELNKIKILKK